MLLAEIFTLRKPNVDNLFDKAEQLMDDLRDYLKMIPSKNLYIQQRQFYIDCAETLQQLRHCHNRGQDVTKHLHQLIRTLANN